MKSVNKVILLGNLTRDPELKQAAANILSVSLGWQQTGPGQSSREKPSSKQPITALLPLTSLLNKV
jgi:hypothetical protein